MFTVFISCHFGASDQLLNLHRERIKTLSGRWWGVWAEEVEDLGGPCCGALPAHPAGPERGCSVATVPGAGGPLRPGVRRLLPSLSNTRLSGPIPTPRHP